MLYEMPAEPASGMVTDPKGITWSRDAGGLYDPAPCPCCGATMPGGLPWSRLLTERGPLTDPTETPAEAKTTTSRRPA